MNQKQSNAPARRDDRPEWKQKELEEKMLALSVVEKQFPEMQKLRAILKENPEEFRRQYAITLIDTVSKTLGVPQSGIDVLVGKPYVNKGGLTYRIQKDPRRVKRILSVPVIYPIKIVPMNQAQDEEFKRYFIGCSEDGTCIYQGIIEFEDGSRFEDQGTANAKYLNREYNKMSTMIPYVMELASTRAVNRAMRMATGIGLVSTEELNERGITFIKERASEDISGRKAELIKEVCDAYDKLNFNQAKRIALNNKYGGAAVLEEMSEKALEALLTVLKSEVPVKTVSKEVKSGNEKPAPKKKPSKG